MWYFICFLILNLMKINWRHKVFFRKNIYIILPVKKITLSFDSGNVYFFSKKFIISLSNIGRKGDPEGSCPKTWWRWNSCSHYGIIRLEKKSITKTKLKNLILLFGDFKNRNTCNHYPNGTRWQCICFCRWNKRFLSLGEFFSKHPFEK